MSDIAPEHEEKGNQIVSLRNHIPHDLADF